MTGQEDFEDAEDLRAVEEALADPENAGPPIPWEQVKAELARLDRDHHEGTKDTKDLP
jgi:hypothetical protein